MKLSDTPAADTDPALTRLRMPFPVPWGLLIVLGLYATVVTLYIGLQYWRSPEYQAAVHYREAYPVLQQRPGVPDKREELLAAYEHLLEAARLLPAATALHQELEKLNWRLDRTGGVPRELQLRAGAVAELWRRIQEQHDPYLVIGAAERGWAPDQLVAGPARAFGWAVAGALLILAVWAYRMFGVRREREERREAHVQQTEREIEEIARQRRR